MTSIEAAAERLRRVRSANEISAEEYLRVNLEVYGGDECGQEVADKSEVIDAYLALTDPTLGPLYRIKPLEWLYSQSDDIESYTVHVGLGSYTVSRNREDFEPKNDWLNWRWEYTFDEYYDEESFECESAEDGKQKAWENWLGRLLPNLEAASLGITMKDE